MLLLTSLLFYVLLACDKTMPYHNLWQGWLHKSLNGELGFDMPKSAPNKLLYDCRRSVQSRIKAFKRNWFLTYKLGTKPRNVHMVSGKEVGQGL